MSTIYKVALVIVIIGAINWGMVGIFNVNLVSLLFGVDTFLTNFVYALVGICGLIATGVLLKPLDK
jgi:uncharacterized protein